MTQENIYRTLLADDELPARQRLRQLFADFKEIDIVGEAADGLETVRQVELLKPDLLFLDIEMPGFTGLEVLQQINHFPIVVFCTAFDHYALQAFDSNAVDFIVKPVKVERVQKTIEKLSLLEGRLNKSQMLQMLDSYLQRKEKRPLVSIPVKSGDRTVFIRLTEVSYFQAEEKYVKIITRDGKQHLSEHSLKYLEEKLDEQFLRIHRSFLVNTQLIREVHKYFGSRFLIKMEDAGESRLVSGRNYADKLKIFLDL